jgi:hypothetical protein
MNILNRLYKAIEHKTSSINIIRGVSILIVIHVDLKSLWRAHASYWYYLLASWQSPQTPDPAQNDQRYKYTSVQLFVVPEVANPSSALTA